MHVLILGPCKAAGSGAGPAGSGSHGPKTQEGPCSSTELW